MAEDKIQKSQFQFLVCPECDGLGRKERKVCQKCFGYGAAAWTGYYLLYWGKEINLWQKALENSKEIVKNIINFSLLIFGVLGFAAFGWVLIYLIKANLPPWKFYQFRNWQLFVFWLSLISDSYLIYRFQKDLEKIKYIPKKKYQTTLPAFQPINWSQIKEIKKEQKIDVSEYFTLEAEQAIKKTWQLANKYKQAQAAPLHLLISLLTFDQINIIFSRLGISFTTLKSKIVRQMSQQPFWQTSKTIISPAIYEIIFLAYFSAWRLRQKKVELSELLEVLALQKNEVQELLYDLGITSDKIENVSAWLRIKKKLRENWLHFRRRAVLRPKSTMNRAMTAIATPALDTFSQDLTLLAQAGYLLPCVNREKEFEEIFRIMSGGGRKGIILLGHSGVGKTTIIEGLAQSMIEEDVPPFLQDKRLVSLSIAKLVAGASASEAQQRLMIILNEIIRSGNIVLFVSDIHQLVGISAGKEGSIDLSGVLAQAVANNNIFCLATSTSSDFKRYIEDKSPLDNVLEKVNISEVSGNTAIQILEAKAGAIEYHNQVYFSYDALAEAVNLSDRYLHDRYLPEKAIEIIQEVAAKIKETKGKGSLVLANDVAALVSEKTNIPLAEITKDESEKLLTLEAKIHERIIDQAEAVQMVASSLRRARAEMRDINRPIVNLLFLGPTGVGKTELAKTVAAVYFGDEKNMIRLDMSEYQEKSSLNRLLGAPPGLAGAEAGGYLTEAVRKNPFSLILLDEIEKAHPDILNIFLQVMDDGRLTDNTGRTIDFTNAIIICTSNASTLFIQEKIKAGLTPQEIQQLVIKQELNKYFRPEFLNRFDGIIVFKPLAMADVKEIAKLMLKKVKVNLEERGINLKVSEPALRELAEAGFDPNFGARPLRRVIQERVQDILANYLLAGELSRRDTVVLEGQGKIIIEKAKKI